MNRRTFLGMFAAVPAACAVTGTGGRFPRWFVVVTINRCEFIYPGRHVPYLFECRSEYDVFVRTVVGCQRIGARPGNRPAPKTLGPGVHKQTVTLAHCEALVRKEVLREITGAEARRLLLPTRHTSDEPMKQYTHDEFMALGRAFIRGPGSKHVGLIAREDELAAWDAAGRPDVTPHDLGLLTDAWVSRWT